MKILVVDDNASLARGLKTFLIGEGHQAEIAHTVKSGLEQLAAHDFDLIITDLRLPDGEGLQIMEKARDGSSEPMPEVILMTAFGSVESAVKAMQLGASDYLTKPVSLEEFSFRIKKIEKIRQLGSENVRLERRCESLFVAAGFDRALDDIAGTSPEIAEIKQMIAKVAAYPTTVLITGETGVGKEVAAKAIHNLSPRQNAPFVRVNCASIPETLFESELFGHEKGAFTDARQRRIGSFEAADGGTVFLDEVGEVPIAMQAKLLRVLQEKEITRLGNSKPVDVDVRIIAATNRNLSEMVSAGHFREDLLYRLSVVNIHLPPLRQRRGDLPILCRTLLKRIGDELARPELKLSQAALEILQKQDWPGNIRQLKNALERAVVMSEGSILEPADFLIADSIADHGRLREESLTTSVDSGAGLNAALENLEKQLILAALSESAGVKSRAAEILKIPRTQLLYRMKKLAIGED
ncbi:MAG: Response regulator of zinc sigma-54-dependent two-component system [Candidatus Rifleibacterium amylolyticum]|nr:MAG: Response regulator of zinc sigma-54-dependent two-component system [Candidatus Rifleibacterium amylolyticum]